MKYRRDWRGPPENDEAARQRAATPESNKAPESSAGPEFHQIEARKRKPGAFTIMNNVRDYCDLPGDDRDLLFTLATYCDADGICWPSNAALIQAARKPRRTLQRMLNHLVAAKHIKILSPGRGRNQKRIISLQRYIADLPPNVIQLEVNVPPMSGAFKCASPTYETCAGNYHKELPDTPKGVTRLLSQKGVGFFSVEYDADEQEKIAVYHDELCDRDRHWKRVTKWTRAVSDALAKADADEIRELCEEVLADNGGVNIPRSKTLVRLIWSNY